ncbi:hypothetical protein ACUN0C_13395 [Faunimonas sp. B44]|uniref:hypothetical protein n=1 Tax=Faunimonas sp. B44 TaxID=3461493 RepID=UPI00404479C6
MIDPQGTPAHWLGEIYDGKALREPINVVIVDRAAKSADDAKTRLIGAAALAGYPLREGHSAGYRAWIGDAYHGQIPTERDHAFSNEPFIVDNNHGRIFGPFPAGGAFVFTAAFSRENVDPIAWPAHRFASFVRARDDFAARLAATDFYRGGDPVPLENAILDDPAVMTGDHDGMAALLDSE